jgi:hypothetical protein
MDAYLMYSHLMFTSRLQDTKNVKATEKYIRAGLHWGRDRFYKAKNLLFDLSLIEAVKRRGASGKIEGHYLKIHASATPFEPKNDDHNVLTPESGSATLWFESHKCFNEKEKCFNEKEKGASLRSKKTSRAIPDEVLLPVNSWFESNNENYYKDGKQMKAIKRLYDISRETDKIIKNAEKLKQIKATSMERYWFDCPLTPHDLAARYDRVIAYKLHAEEYEDL